MRVRLIAVGRIREPYVFAACADFRKRIAPYYAYEEIEAKQADGSEPESCVREEGQRIAKLLRGTDRFWLLERTGTELSSAGLAAKLHGVAHAGRPELTLVIAGTYGADQWLHERAEFKWSLSQLTLLHEWARMLVLEQLYRAAKIARNEPYHH